MRFEMSRPCLDDFQNRSTGACWEADNVRQTGIRPINDGTFPWKWSVVTVPVFPFLNRCRWLQDVTHLLLQAVQPRN
jgi:hypothetical protein